MSKDLFEDYQPEILQYDAEVDGQAQFELREDRLKTKENLLEKIRDAKAKAKGNQTTFRQNIRTENQHTKEDPFKDYVPEILVYDAQTDGQAQFELREDRLKTKENLLDKIRDAKARAKGNQTTFRQNIRTENQK